MHSNDMHSLVVSPEISRILAVEAEAALPNEAVGLLGGRHNHATLVLPLPNLAGPRAFFADPYAQYLALQRLKEEGLDLVATYHSHPGGGILPSSTDFEFARLWNCPQLIIALARPNLPGVEIGIYDSRDAI